MKLWKIIENTVIPFLAGVGLMHIYLRWVK